MKIGIITMLYNSCNYGGILQAYALQKFLSNNGYDTEQILYQSESAYPSNHRIIRFIKKYLLKLISLRNPIVLTRLELRKVIVKKNALRLIRHSDKIYKENNIKKTLKIYDTFITGSDQVWYGIWPAYFLSFVPSNYKKISYAASTGKSNLSDKDLLLIKHYTKDFSGISLREADNVSQLSKYIPEKNILHVLDPTFLLEKSDWDNITSRSKIKEPYIFCYFLGNDKKLRVIAQEYAKFHNKKLVFIPHMQGRIEKNDLKFGDIQVFDCTPQDFLSLISNAEIIFTDSFHACVFSIIFEKQFFVFGRNEYKGMNNRIETLLKMFNLLDRFLLNNNNLSINNINHIEKILYPVYQSEYETLKSHSIDYIKDVLK